jgi:hypothetical protein
VHLGYGMWIWLSVSKLPLKCAIVSLYSVVKQRLKCNTGKVCNCLIQFLLTMARGHHFQHSDFPNALYELYRVHDHSRNIRALGGEEHVGEY